MHEHHKYTYYRFYSLKFQKKSADIYSPLTNQLIYPLFPDHSLFIYLLLHFLVIYSSPYPYLYLFAILLYMYILFTCPSSPATSPAAIIHSASVAWPACKTTLARLTHWPLGGNFDQANSLWPSDTIWPQRSLSSTLAQVMAYFQAMSTTHWNSTVPVI